MTGMIKWIFFGGTAGLLGAAIWAAIVYFTGMNIGYVAIGVGILAGLGVRFGSPEATGVVPGITAAVITAVSMLVGQVGVIYALIVKEFGAAPPVADIIKDLPDFLSPMTYVIALIAIAAGYSTGSGGDE